MDIPLALKWKHCLEILASMVKTPKTRVRRGKFARKFLHWASDTSYIEEDKVSFGLMTETIEINHKLNIETSGKRRELASAKLDLYHWQGNPKM